MNKILIISLLIIPIILIMGCSSPKKIVPLNEVNYISEMDEIMKLSSKGIGLKEEDALINAEKNAFNVLLFRGLPNSQQKIGLIGINENEIISKHQEYFKLFYDEKRYRSFITTKNISTKTDNNNSVIIVLELEINLRSLRSDLEQSNIIRKFGF